ncbi:TetR/AcrR family transcriptional regulator [Rhodococcus sp. NBC_00297]|uniref:TetR/AcrR family transcriptional regulator n=1 Tax=Rhodococcus sp. NBC_00297 TaxID=2976005 RepID=UPI002E29ADAA|nr:TetR family transcriptional regulator [Rhodococcus sp. NBC_00297]
MTRTKTAPRRPDRSRRQRIIDATLTVIADFGVEGLTHRRVAVTAGVPASAPSYYFDSIEDLLQAALVEVVALEMQAFRRRLSGLESVSQLPELLAAYVVEGVRQDPAKIVVFGELHVAALRRTGLREVVNEWDSMWLDLLAPMIGARAALTTTLLSGELSQRALRSSDNLDAAEVEEIFRSACGLPQNHVDHT